MYAHTADTEYDCPEGAPFFHIFPCLSPIISQTLLRTALHTIKQNTFANAKHFCKLITSDKVLWTKARNKSFWRVSQKKHRNIITLAVIVLGSLLGPLAFTPPKVLFTALILFTMKSIPTPNELCMSSNYAFSCDTDKCRQSRFRYITTILSTRWMLTK